MKFIYTNYKGQTSIRSAIPLWLWYGETVYHPEVQWLMFAYDLDKKAWRNFAVVDVKF